MRETFGADIVYVALAENPARAVDRVMSAPLSRN
jgi:hypothetical protein